MNNNATAFDDSYNLAEFNLLLRGLGLPTQMYIQFSTLLTKVLAG